MRTLARRYPILFAALLAATVASAHHLPSPVDAAVPYEGTFSILTGDPDPETGGPAKRLYVLTTDDGQEMLLHFADGSLPDSGVHALFGKRIQVNAAVLPAFLAEDFGGRPLYNVASAKPIGAKALEKVTGTLPYVSLLCKFSDIPDEPQPPAFFTTQLNNTAPGFDHYFREATYNTVMLTGSTVSATWAFLPQPRSFYITGAPGSEVANLNALFDDCTAAHDATINFAGVHGINLMFNGKLDNSAWGGGRFRTLDATNRVWPTTWMPYYGPATNQRFGWRTHGVLAHEMSHSFGAPHSDDPFGFEYGSGWDVVSNPGAKCTTVDTNYGCLGQHMNAYAKTLIGAIAPARIATHTTGTQSYNVERLALPPNVGGTYQMLKINTAVGTRYYTVESRLRTGNYDNQLYGDGVIIHEVDTVRATGNPARLQAPGGTTAQYTGKMGSLWLPGMTFRNAADNIAITINSFSGTGTANVTVAPYVAFTDPFPPSCALPAGWIVPPTGAEGGWSADPTNGAIGNCSLVANALADPPNDGSRVQAEIQYTGTFIAGNITFWARVSAEPGWDCLRFLLDNVQQNVGTCTNGLGLGITGSGGDADSGWKFFSFPVTAGSHTVKWSYDRDYNGPYFAGQDKAWIDAVSFPVAAPGADLSIVQAALPSPGNVAKDIVYTLTAANAGPVGATNVVVTDAIPAGSTFVWASPGCVFAAGNVTCTVGALASGANTQRKVVLRPGSVGTAANNVSITATETDPTPANNASLLNVTVNTNPVAAQALRYRLYSPVTLEHHFTTDLNEYNVLGGFVGTWVQEGTVGKMLNNPGSFNAVVAVPYYRLYDTNTRWHHWTTDANEYYTLGYVYAGWNMEGIDGYILPSATAGAVQLYRLNFPALGALHHWTIDANEYNTLITPAYGWVGEGGSGFVIQ